MKRRTRCKRCGHLYRSYCGKCHYRWTKKSRQRYGKSAKGKARDQKYQASAKGTARTQRYYIRKIHIGRRVVALASTAEMAKKIRAFIRQRKAEYDRRCHNSHEIVGKSES